MELLFSLALLSPYQVDLLLSKLPHSIDVSKHLSYDSEGKNLTIRFEEPVDASMVQARVRSLIDQVRQMRAIKRKVIYQNHEGTPHARPSTPPSVTPQRRELAVRLAEACDGLFRELAERYTKHFRQYPTLISQDTLEKCNYIRMFPQNVFLVSEFPHDSDALHAVQNDCQYGDHVRLSRHALPPTICFHTYEEFAGQVLQEPMVLSAKGHCFRHEAPERISGWRLNDFSMREIIFLGSPEFVKDVRNRIQAETWGLFCELGLKGRVETASDPFFSSEDYLRGLHQMISDLKYELVTVMESTGESLAVASFNVVNDTLCKSFNICSPAGQPLHSGCVGFGIDRWVYALTTTFGQDLSAWPESVRTKLRLTV